MTFFERPLMPIAVETIASSATPSCSIHGRRRAPRPPHQTRRLVPSRLDAARGSREAHWG
eukprot:5196870-Prymnesium_polylepis.1